MAKTKKNEVTDSRKRVLLVDDHAVVRFGIAQLVNRQADLVVSVNNSPPAVEILSPPDFDVYSTATPRAKLPR